MWLECKGTDTVGTHYQGIDISEFPATPWLSMRSANHYFLHVCMSLPYTTYTCFILILVSHIVTSSCTSIASVVHFMPEYSVVNYYYPKKILSATGALGAHYKHNWHKNRY